MQARRLGELAGFLGASLRGDADAQVSGLAAIQSATPGTLSFVASPKYQSWLTETKATAVIVSPAMADRCPVAALVVDQPYVAFARVSHLFATEPPTPPGVHPSAIVAPGVQLPASVHVGALAVVEEGAVLGEGVVVGAQCYVGAGARLGDRCRLWPNVTIYHGVKIGQRTIIHAGAVIGADGFGFAPNAGKWEKIAQVGGVIIGDDVEVGALTTIDRGAIEDTIIGNGVILDDQVHIAHNVVVGDYTAMAGKSGISGSTKVGKHCLLSGMAGLVGHIELCDNVQVSGMTVVSRSITRPGVYTSGTGMEEHGSWAKNAARFRQLDAMARRLAEVERRLREIDGPGEGEV